MRCDLWFVINDERSKTKITHEKQNHYSSIETNRFLFKEFIDSTIRHPTHSSNDLEFTINQPPIEAIDSVLTLRTSNHEKLLFNMKKKTHTKDPWSRTPHTARMNEINFFGIVRNK